MFRLAINLFAGLDLSVSCW